MGLTVALNDSLLAEGQLYWDDGVRIGMYDVSCHHKKLFPGVKVVWQDAQTLLAKANPFLEALRESAFRDET